MLSSYNFEELRVFLDEKANEAESLRARLLTDFTDAVVGGLASSCVIQMQVNP